MERIEPTLLDVFPLQCGSSFAFLGPAPLGEQLPDVGRPALCVTSFSVAPVSDPILQRTTGIKVPGRFAPSVKGRTFPWRHLERALFRSRRRHGSPRPRSPPIPLAAVTVCCARTEASRLRLGSRPRAIVLGS